jgi:hypothetical protein
MVYVSLSRWIEREKRKESADLLLLLPSSPCISHHYLTILLKLDYITLYLLVTHHPYLLYSIPFYSADMETQNAGPKIRVLCLHGKLRCLPFFLSWIRSSKAGCICNMLLQAGEQAGIY